MVATLHQLALIGLGVAFAQVVFTQRAVKHIHDVAGSNDPLFLVVAYHNVHDACQKDRFTAGLNAPYETVQLYPDTKLDTWKVQAAMTTELDYGVANITGALRSTGLWETTVLILVSRKRRVRHGCSDDLRLATR